MQSNNHLIMKDTSYLVDILQQLDKSLELPYNHNNAFSFDDLIQILKEMNQIACKAKSSE